MYRKIHRSPPLQLDGKMSSEAEWYARKIAQLGVLDHSGTMDGESIASVCKRGNSIMSGKDAASIW